MVSGGETKSQFLADSAEAVALHGKNANDESLLARHAYFIKLLSEAGQAMPELGLLAACLSDGAKLARIRARLEAGKARPSDKVTFKVGDSYPLESDVWHNWWRGFRKGLPGVEAKQAKCGSLRPMRCFVTGQLADPVPTHRKIEKLSDVGGQSTGDALVCFDKEAFRSYCLEQSANAAVSEQAMCAYRSGLNSLIRDHSQRLAGAKVVHWFKGKGVNRDEDPLVWLEEGADVQEMNAQHRAKELLDSLRTGKRADLADSYFYALTLSGAAGRVMVRDWMEGRFEVLAHNVSEWFDDLQIVRRDGNALSPSPKFLAVVGSTVRELRDLPAPFVTKMWRVAVRGEPVPASAMAQALVRVRVAMIKDEAPNHAGMGLLKMYHIRRNRIEGGVPLAEGLRPYLNEEHPSPAYQCGRLVAVLAALQRSALGDVGAGLVQRYYAAASTTPALVLGSLTRTSHFHLNKLEPGLAYWYEDKIASIWGRLKDGLPRTVSLEEQSLFALGYYQQMADLRTKKSGDVETSKGGRS
ncbi:MAG: type I-C CRISPR-associated protein Cas8c/Csd1 [Chloroflexi bacterium]|nr:type I-C CRISPR-associated protein Cas8c/Csd1 [Chloroflexota bacterium]